MSSAGLVLLGFIIGLLLAAEDHRSPGRFKRLGKRVINALHLISKPTVRAMLPCGCSIGFHGVTVTDARILARQVTCARHGNRALGRDSYLSITTEDDS